MSNWILFNLIMVIFIVGPWAALKVRIGDEFNSKQILNFSSAAYSG